MRRERVAALLMTALAAWSASGNGGSAWASGDADALPAVRFYRKGNLPNLESLETFEQWRPDLVVVLHARGDREHESLPTHAAARVPELWVVDLDASVIERLALDESLGVYSRVESVQGTTAFCPASFAGLTIPLGNIWDAWHGSLGRANAASRSGHA